MALEEESETAAGKKIQTESVNGPTRFGPKAHLNNNGKITLKNCDDCKS